LNGLSGFKSLACPLGHHERTAAVVDCFHQAFARTHPACCKKSANPRQTLDVDFRSCASRNSLIPLSQECRSSCFCDALHPLGKSDWICEEDLHFFKLKTAPAPIKAGAYEDRMRECSRQLVVAANPMAIAKRRHNFFT
jgi:hypothetical protein